MTITLGEIPLPSDLVWADEIWSPVSETVAITCGGSVVIQAAAQVSGRPITLAGSASAAWITRATLEALMTIAANPAWSGTLDLHGTTYTVRIRHADGPVSAAPVMEYADGAIADDQYNNVVLRLREVA